MIVYFRHIWAIRHFWLHLSRAELRARFRNSTLGVLWAVLQPLLLTLLIAFVLGNVFGSTSIMREFAPFVFSGVLVWEFLAGSVIGGCGSFLAAAPYIQLQRLPLAIYPLKTVIARLMILGLGIVGLVLWVLVVEPGNLGLSWLSLAPSFVLLMLVAWPVAIVAGFVNTKFRDFEQFVGLLLQALWFASPVFLSPDLFRKRNIAWLLDYNPVTHLLNLVRQPLLHGTMPTATDYLYVVGTGVGAWLLAGWCIRRDERRIVFYL